MWGLLIRLLMAILIGYIGESLVRGYMPGGPLGAMIAGLAGSWLGTAMLGAWGPVIAGFAVIPAIVGAALFVFLLGLLGRAMQRAA